jgi:hypothetical protein
MIYTDNRHHPSTFFPPINCKLILSSDLTDIINQKKIFWGFIPRSVRCFRSQWPSDLRRGSAFASLLGSTVRIGCICLASVVCCQIEVSVTGRSLVQRSPTDCGASLCVIYKSHKWGSPGPRWADAKTFQRILLLPNSERLNWFRMDVEVSASRKSVNNWKRLPESVPICGSWDIRLELYPFRSFDLPETQKPSQVVTLPKHFSIPLATVQSP